MLFIATTELPQNR